MTGGEMTGGGKTVTGGGSASGTTGATTGTVEWALAGAWVEWCGSAVLYTPGESATMLMRALGGVTEGSGAAATRFAPAGGATTGGGMTAGTGATAGS